MKHGEKISREALLRMQEEKDPALDDLRDHLVRMSNETEYTYLEKHSNSALAGMGPALKDAIEGVFRAFGAPLEVDDMDGHVLFCEFTYGPCPWYQIRVSRRREAP